jgi:hypothetical protein
VFCAASLDVTSGTAQMIASIAILSIMVRRIVATTDRPIGGGTPTITRL